MINLKRRFDECWTIARYDVTDDIVREVMDETPESSQPWPLPPLRSRHSFRPTLVRVQICWATGKTSVEMSGPRYGWLDGPSAEDRGDGYARVELDHYDDADTVPSALARDAINATCGDHDARTI